MAGAYFDAILGFAVFLIAHVSLWRIHPSNSPRMLMMIPLSILGWAAALISAVLFGRNDVVSFYHTTGMVTFLLITYIYFYAGICRSVSVTLLEMVRSKGGGPIPMQDVISEYEKSERFEDRLLVMREMGWIEMTNGNVILTKKGMNVSKFVQFVSFFVAQSGLEG